MKQETKLSQKQAAVTEHQATTQAAREFATSEEMLRADAVQTIVPPAIEERLKKSVTRLHLPAARPWWKNLLGR